MSNILHSPAWLYSENFTSQPQGSEFSETPSWAYVKCIKRDESILQALVQCPVITCLWNYVKQLLLCIERMDPVVSQVHHHLPLTVCVCIFISVFVPHHNLANNVCLFTSLSPSSLTKESNRISAGF